MKRLLVLAGLILALAWGQGSVTSTSTIVVQVSANALACRFLAGPAPGEVVLRCPPVLDTTVRLKDGQSFTYQVNEGSDALTVTLTRSGGSTSWQASANGTSGNGTL